MERLQTDLCSFSFYSLLFLPPFSSLLSEFQMDYPDCRAQTLPACQVLLFPSSSFLTASVATPSFCGGLKVQEELCTPMYQCVRAVVTSSTPVCPTESSAGRKGIFLLQKESKALQKPLGWFCRRFLGRGVSCRDVCAASPSTVSGFLRPGGPFQGYPWNVSACSRSSACFPHACFSLESCRKQGGFGWCL